MNAMLMMSDAEIDATLADASRFESRKAAWKVEELVKVRDLLAARAKRGIGYTCEFLGVKALWRGADLGWLLVVTRHTRPTVTSNVDGLSCDELIDLRIALEDA